MTPDESAIGHVVDGQSEGAGVRRIPMGGGGQPLPPPRGMAFDGSLDLGVASVCRYAPRRVPGCQPSAMR